MNKGFSSVALVIILVVIILGVDGYFVFSNKSVTTPTQPTNTITQPATPTANQKSTPSGSKTAAGGPGAIVNYHIANVPLKQGYYDWSIPRGFISSLFGAGSVSAVNNKIDFVISLKAAGVQFSFPAKDEQLKEGQTYRVKWTVPTPANDEQVEIAITNPGFEASTPPVSWSPRFYVVYNAFSITNVSGLKSVYAPGESVSVSLRGTEADNSPATSDGGFIAWADVIPNGARNVSGIYDSATKSWKLDLQAPSSAGQYTLQVYLGCGSGYNPNAACVTKYPGQGAEAKVLKFSVSSN